MKPINQEAFLCFRDVVVVSGDRRDRLLVPLTTAGGRTADEQSAKT
jgi:hypothetical protein